MKESFEVTGLGEDNLSTLTNLQQQDSFLFYVPKSSDLMDPLPGTSIDVENEPVVVK